MYVCLSALKQKVKLSVCKPWRQKG